MARRTRLDRELVRRGLARSRQHAAELVEAGRVRVHGVQARKVATLVDPADPVRVSGEPTTDYVSRGGHKLAGALREFGPAGLVVAGRRCLDAGASTGGFTDVLLERGARIVYAVDVGRGQLIDRLRRDPRVVAMERTNLRTLGRLPEPIDLATLDLSFISLRLVLPAVRRLLTDQARVIALVKPQFEAGRGQVPRGGVVHDPEVHRDVLIRLAGDAEDAGLHPAALIRSPVTGADGNVEFLAELRVPELGKDEWVRWVERVVDATD
jgi:23S rRNA (cytidine1920-2'-O)/16S rRNA (cytidine1409-2'-O)-methyltransferase